MPPTIVSIWAANGSIQIAEHAANPRLPAACPDLHINSNGTFCLGRFAFSASDWKDAQSFWAALHEFLVNEEFAERRAFWPRGRWLSHGLSAMRAQLEAEDYAARLGLASEYSDWLEAKDGPLSLLFTKDPQDAECPVITCPTRTGRASKRSCSHRKMLKRLALTEGHRARMHQEHYSFLQSSGVECCGRIPNCALARLGAAA